LDRNPGARPTGTPATELSRRHGVHTNTIRLWKDKYTGLETSDLVRLKQLEEESRRKDRIIARQALELDAMKESRAGAHVARERLTQCTVAGSRLK
jgi:putative transposase